jgi:hypothetical protein
MPVYGDLNTMSLSDLLQWASMNRKTGVLELERNKICRRIEFRNGWIGACSSDDPPARIGQFLLSRGKISKQQLQDALSRQEVMGQNLGMILLEMGAMTQQELKRQIAAKAEEMIQSLFDWDEAVFRFHEGANLDNQIEVSLSVRDVLFRGLQHHDELKRIRGVFQSSGVVLRRTERDVPDQVLKRAIARRIFESIDGKRTLAEVLLHAHASEFLVIKLLFKLHEMGLVEIAEERDVGPDAQSLLDSPEPEDPTRTSNWMEMELAASAKEPDPKSSLRDISPDTASTGMSRTPETGRETDVETEIEVANRLSSRGEYEAALELLNASYRAHPGDSYLRRLIAKAEAAFIESVRRHGLASDKVPIRMQLAEGDDPADLGSEESFLLSLIDGETDIKSIMWVAPLREVDVLRSLRQMLERGLIGLREPQSAGCTAAPTETGASG